MGIVISINIVSCRRKIRAYHAPLDLVGSMNHNASRCAREDEEASQNERPVTLNFTACEQILFFRAI